MDLQPSTGKTLLVKLRSLYSNSFRYFKLVSVLGVAGLNVGESPVPNSL